VARTAALAVSSALAATFLSLSPGPAGAANPGANGLIVYASFVASTPGSQIFAVDPSGGTPLDLSGTTYDDDEPAVSPDGTRIAFRHNSAIWIMNVDGSGRHQVGGMGSEEGPSWSPDGTHLAFSTDARPDGFSYGGPNIWTMRDDGTERTQLTNDARSEQPAWAPDGSEIAYVSTGPDNRDIYALNPDGTGVTNLTRTPNVDENGPDWSPDASKIAYSSTDLADHGPNTVGPDLWTMLRDGSAQTPLMHHNGPGEISDGADPAWSPDGTQIAFAANNGTGGLHVWRMAATGGHDVQVTAEPGNPGDQELSWQPSPSPSTSTSTTSSTSSASTSSTSSSTTTSTIAPSTTSTSAPSTTTTSTPPTPICASLQQQLQTVGDSLASARLEALILGFGCRLGDGPTTTTTAQPTTTTTTPPFPTTTAIPVSAQVCAVLRNARLAGGPFARVLVDSLLVSFGCR
jgi:TolB protein